MNVTLKQLDMLASQDASPIEVELELTKTKNPVLIEEAENSVQDPTVKKGPAMSSAEVVDRQRTTHLPYLSVMV